MEAVWDGIVHSAVLHEAEANVRHALSDASRDYDWNGVLKVLGEHQGLVNTTRLDGTSLYTPLHQAAHGGASVEVVSKLLELGAWRTLQNARGERPLDVAKKLGHSHLLGVLTPDMKRRVPAGVLLKMQNHFHEVILGRAEDQVREHGLRLPELEPLLEYEQIQIWFPVPGMYGGFSYHLKIDGIEAILVAESWCRVVGGSGQRHEITSECYKLVEEGFV